MELLSQHRPTHPVTSSMVSSLISNLTQHQFLYNITAKCQDVNHLSTISEQCQFVQTVDDCLNDDNLFSYIQFAYCHIGSQMLGTALLLVWLLFLFVAIGITADDFLCPLLITIAKSLKMSDNIAGVTFLAFGNGAPDIFSSIIGIGQHDSSLIIGELYGAGIFVTTVVVGSIMIQNQFQIMKRPLLRDISFYLATTTLVWSIFFSGQIRLYNSLLYIGIYLFYVTVVIISGYIYRKNQQKRDLNETRTAQRQMFAKFHMPGEKPTNSPTKYKLNEFGEQKEGGRSIKEGLKKKISLKNYLPNQNVDNYEGVVLRRIKYRQYCHNPLYQRRFTIYNISDTFGLNSTPTAAAAVTGAAGAAGPEQPFQQRRMSKLESEICAVAESNANCQLASSVFAINFDTNNNNNNFDCEASNDKNPGPKADWHQLAIGGGDHNYQYHQSHITHNDRRPTLSDTGFKTISISSKLKLSQFGATTVPSPPPPAPTNKFNDSSRSNEKFSVRTFWENIRQFFYENLLCQSFTVDRDEEESGNNKNNSSHNNNNNCSNCINNNHHNKSSDAEISNNIPNISNNNDNINQINGDKDANNNNNNSGTIVCNGDQDLNHKNQINSQVCDCGTDCGTDGEFMKKLRTKQHKKKFRFRKQAKSLGNFCLESSNIELKEFFEANFFAKVLMLIKAPIYFALTLTIPVVDLDMPLNGWYKSLILIQILVSPQICLILTGLSVQKLKFHLISFVASLILIPVVGCTSEKNRQPIYHTLFAYIGFLIAVIVIYTIANEVVDLLTTLGIMFNISNFILGITVLAWGNSIGDFISNMSMARNGFPRMAISACFGGPVLNMLLGIGIPYTVLLVKNDLGSIHLHYSNMITVLYSTITASLLTTVVILVCFTHFKSTRTHGFVLYGLYFCFLCASICAELKLF